MEETFEPIKNVNGYDNSSQDIQLLTTISCFQSRLDYKEEQTNELEALQSIYPDEYEEISTDPGEFTIHIVPEEQDGDDTCKCNILLCQKTRFRCKACQVLALKL